MNIKPNPFNKIPWKSFAFVAIILLGIGLFYSWAFVGLLIAKGIKFVIILLIASFGFFFSKKNNYFKFDDFSFSNNENDREAGEITIRYDDISKLEVTQVFKASKRKENSVRKARKKECDCFIYIERQSSKLIPTTENELIEEEYIESFSFDLLPYSKKEREEIFNAFSEKGFDTTIIEKEEIK